MTRENKKAEGNWSSLPVLLLWMIKDKLDIFDNLCLSAVCREWRSANSNYPKKQSVRDGMPWIIQVVRGDRPGEFIIITIKKKFTLDLPKFSRAKVLYSKQGWILIRRRNFLKEKLSNSLFLINAFTKAEIEMPNVADTYRYYVGSFSTHEGHPERVFLLNPDKRCQITVRTACPGDMVWTEHSYMGQQVQFLGRCALITIGEKVYIFNFMGKMIIYNMANQVWKELPGPEDGFDPKYVLEHEGKLVKIVPSGSYKQRLYHVFRYNETNTSWESFNNDDLKDTCWYLSTLHSSYSVRGKGLKAYILKPRNGCTPPHRIMRGFDALYHDFTDGKTKTLDLPYFA